MVRRACVAVWRSVMIQRRASRRFSPRIAMNARPPLLCVAAGSGARATDEPLAVGVVRPVVQVTEYEDFAGRWTRLRAWRCGPASRAIW